MHRNVVPGFSRIAAFGVAALLVFGAPGTSQAHWFDWFHGHGGNHDHGRDNGHGHDDGHGNGNGNGNGGQCCGQAGQCDDGNPCTADSCNNGVCTHAPLAGCQVCAKDADCSAANACMQGDCNNGVCCQIAIPSCTPCTTDAGCNDSNACTTDACQAGICKHQATPGCVACTTAVECDDQNAQTVDTCAAGICLHQPITPTPVEICGDGIDNDGNGLSDCADPACAGFAGCAKPTEICDDGIDNDGDGLIDYEDPDCCAQVLPLLTKKVIVRPEAKRLQDRLRLKSAFRPTASGDINPMTQDTTLQISDANGLIFYATIARNHFMPRGKRRMAFWGGAPFANGLSDGRFTIKRNGTVKFRTHGRGASVRPSDAKSIRVTLRVGGRCMQANVASRAKKNVLLFP